MLLFLFVLAVSSRVIYVGDGFQYKANELQKAVADAETNDIIELRGSEFIVPNDANGVCLTIRRPVTLRAGTGSTTPPIIRPQNAETTDVVIGIGESNVHIENIVIGRPLIGAAISMDRIIGVFVSAGTQDAPSAYGPSTKYRASGGAFAAEQIPRSAPIGSIRAARDLKKRSATKDDLVNRALTDISVVNVDFTASMTHTNIAFGPGAYANARVVSCRFSESADANSIVVASGSRFVNAHVERNSFGGSPVILNGDNFDIGSNFWAASLRKDQLTYCLDRTCSRLGPVVDADTPSRAYATLAEAVIAGVQNIVITVHEVEWARSPETACAVISIAETTIEGVDINECSQAPDDDIGLGVTNVNIRNLCKTSMHGAITTIDGALTSVRNVQFTVHAGVTTAIAVVPTRGSMSVTGGTPAATLLLDHVSVYGLTGQTAFSIASSAMRVLMNAVKIYDVSVGISHRSGSLSVTSSLILSEEIGIHLAGASGTKHALRVVDTMLFKAVGISFGEIKTTALTEFYVSCCRFVFSTIKLPVDCASNGQICASGLRHNSFVVQRGTLSDAALGVLARGANHYEEEDDLSAAQQYYKYTSDVKRSQFSFQLNDNQGRIDDASGVATIGGAHTHWTFALVTNIPMRQECFAATIPSIDGVKGRVVSNLFELHTDAPEACVSVALRVSLANLDTNLQPKEELSIYAVDHIGTASTSWVRAASHTVKLSNDELTTAVDASSGRGELLRSIVVAAHTSISKKYDPVQLAPERVAPHAALAVTRSTLGYCVACGTDRIPSNILDERCGGSSAQVFSNLETAFAAVGSSKMTTVSLLIYGDKCVTRACTVDLGVMTPNKLTIEGLSPSEQGHLRRPSSCATSVPFIRTGLGVSMRYLRIGADSAIVSAIPICAIEAPARVADGPRLAFLMISGGVCIGKQRTNTVLLNNEINVSSGKAISIDDGATGTSIDSNVIVSGVLRVGSSSVQITSNAFSVNAWIDIADGAQVVATQNTFAARRADAKGPTPCVVASEKAKTQFINSEFADHCELRFTGVNHQISGGTEWRGVRAFITGASQVVGVVIGTGSFIRGEGGVILDNLSINTKTTTVGAALLGTPGRKTACGKDFEPALGGFALDKSDVSDLNDNAIFENFEWPTDDNQYVDFITGQINSCSDVVKSNYCACIGNKIKKVVEVKPRVTAPPLAPVPTAPPHVLSKADAIQRQKKFEEAVVPLDTSSNTHTAIWIVFSILPGILVCICICAVIALGRRSRGYEGVVLKAPTPPSTKQKSKYFD